MSAPQSKFEILQAEISETVQKTSARSQNNKVKAFRIYIGITVASALITFFVAIGNDIPQEWQLASKIVILTLSSTSTVLAAWDGFYNHKQLWINYGDTHNQLRAILLKMNLLDDNERKDTKMLNDVYQEYQKILNDSNVKWKSIRVDEKDKA